MQQPPHPQSYPQQPPYQYPPQQQPAQDLQPRSSYYRYDYEKIRQSAPTRQAQAQAQAQAQSSAPPAHPPQHHYSHPVPPPPPGEHYSNSSRSNKRNDAHAYPHEYQYPPPADYHYREPSPPPPPPGDYYGSPPPQPPPAYPPAYPPSYPASYPAPYAPTPSHSPDKEKRHKSKSRSHRQEHPSSAPPPPGYAPAPHIPDAPPPAIRVCRILTLLIEDKRDPNGESLLAEVRVPLKPAEPGDEGFWADAQEVSEELQRGPSRIDGAAKVYTLRGKYKQYFLRITADGEPICQPANLKVTPERTVEIYIEEVSTSPLRRQEFRLTRASELATWREGHRHAQFTSSFAARTAHTYDRLDDLALSCTCTFTSQTF
ncbi:hypothetical protein C8Q73DRAFT_644792 [Cubamyces lactineus]|nr:hypothetical protein C8Q73DRAFT_644792 [Cubamyces lactineus]